MEKFKCYQDGCQFYVDTVEHPDYDGNQPVADYGFMVSGDHDMIVAKTAREQFLKAYGNFCEL